MLYLQNDQVYFNYILNRILDHFVDNEIKHQVCFYWVFAKNKPNIFIFLKKYTLSSEEITLSNQPTSGPTVYWDNRNFLDRVF
jgi:hypothetical protein